MGAELGKLQAMIEVYREHLGTCFKPNCRRCAEAQAVLKPYLATLAQLRPDQG